MLFRVLGMLPSLIRGLPVSPSCLGIPMSVAMILGADPDWCPKAVRPCMPRGEFPAWPRRHALAKHLDGFWSVSVLS